LRESYSATVCHTQNYCCFQFSVVFWNYANNI